MKNSSSIDIGNSTNIDGDSTTPSAILGLSVLVNFKKEKEIEIARICLYLLVVIFHLIGLYLLVAAKRQRAYTPDTHILTYTNIRLLTLLSISQALNHFFMVVVIAGRFSGQAVVVIVATGLFWITSGLSLSTYYLITLNRLLSIRYPLWYRTSMTEKKFTLLSVSVCVFITGANIGASAMFWIFYVRSPVITWICSIVLYLLVDIFLVFCVSTYVVMFVTILKSRKNTRQRIDNSGNAISRTTTIMFVWLYIKKGGYTTPLLITFSFLVFVAFPFTVRAFCQNSRCFGVSVRVWNVTGGVNGLCDALIYVFFDQDLRNHLKKIFTRKDVARIRSETSSSEV